MDKLTHSTNSQRHEDEHKLVPCCLKTQMVSCLKVMEMGFITPEIITIAKYYFSENKTIDPGLILEPRVNW